MKIHLTLFLFIRLLAIPAVFAESPSGQDLKDACQNYMNSIEENYVSEMLCIWYVTPCDCQSRKDALPRVCLPSVYQGEELIKQVLMGLEEHKELLKKDAAVAANTILKEYYPCD